MEKLVIHGGRRLEGRVKISGAKNAVLPIIAATLLGQDSPSLLDEVPALEDVHTITEVLQKLGVKAEFRKETHQLFVDLHLKGFEALGAQIRVGHGFIEAAAPEGLKGAKIYLDFPSVGATENIIMAASMAEGQTVLENPAQEPEIVDLANYLNVMGAKIRGAGTNVIKIDGVPKLTGRDYTIIPDRIEAGTYMVAAAMTRGDVYIENAIIAKLKEAGVTIEEDVNGIRVTCDRRTKSVDIKTMPYPGFPTDMQAQFMAMMAISEGTGIVTETVFENRFMHVDELKRMGAKIKIDGRTSIVEGVEKLYGCQVKATDLRAGAAMVLAGLVAEGETQVGYIHHIDRGYDNLVEKLVGLGADICRVDQ